MVFEHHCQCATVGYNTVAVLLRVISNEMMLDANNAGVNNMCTCL